MDFPSPDVVAQIANAHELVARFDKWPSFTGAEVLTLSFDRGNHCQIVDSGAWDQRKPESLTATFYVFDELESFDSPLRRPTIVTLRFESLAEFRMDGFNYQNPIVDMGIAIRYSERLKKNIFVVDWGRTALQHDVSFGCERIVVTSVKPSAA